MVELFELKTSMKSNLKLSILTSSDFPYGMAMESFVRQLSLGLIANNIELEVVRLYGDRLNNLNDTNIRCSNYLFKKPMNIEFFKFLEVLFHVLFIPFFISYRRLIKREHVIIMYGLDRAYFVFPITIFAKIFGIKIFRVNTEVYPYSSYASNWWRKPLILFNELQIKYFDKYLDGIIVLSHFLKKLEIKNGVREKKILLIPHFIDVNIATNSECSVEKTKIDRIGYCGNPSIENGILDLIDAFIILDEKRKNNVELIIIGEIIPSVNQEIKKRILKNIIFTGKLNKSEVSIELQKCKVLVNPRRIGVSADSGFPTKIGEYFAANKTVVATEIGDLSLYFKDKQELVFAEPNSSVSICNAIDYVLQNKELSLQIAKRGNDWAINNLDYKKNSKKLIEFIFKNKL
jgi:glycosyltransferase involved in cell wall biosynthesis